MTQLTLPNFTQRAIVIRLKNDPIQFVKMNSITPEQKKYILELGPCQPLPEDVPGKMYPRDKYGRHFNHLWYYRIIPDGTKVIRDWLSYSLSTQYFEFTVYYTVSTYTAWHLSHGLKMDFQLGLMAFLEL